MDAELLNLIDRYWDLAYAEGKEGRTHDTKDGAAASCRYEIEKRIRELNRPHFGGDGEDAARYRWLKAGGYEHADDEKPHIVVHRQDSWGNWRDAIIEDDEADAAIDAARAGERGVS